MVERLRAVDGVDQRQRLPRTQGPPLIVGCHPRSSLFDTFPNRRAAAVFALPLTVHAFALPASSRSYRPLYRPLFADEVAAARALSLLPSEREDLSICLVQAIKAALHPPLSDLLAKGRKMGG
jgi:hypothetical protein